MALDRLTKIIADHQVEALVVGLPLNMDGSEGGQAKIVRQFAQALRRAVEIPVYFQDERLSSFGAEEKLAPADLTRAGKKKRLDAVAAAEILEAFLQQKYPTGDTGIDPASP